jgi:YidC/Oxa1 family membrane protein insertase
LLDPLYTAISWVMARWHSLWNLIFGDPAPESGLAGIAWVLAIVFLVVTIRLILFPLFVKQIKSQRAMQELQPEMAKLRKQFGSDRQGLSQAMMALQKERGVNPLAGCLPILPQIPVFLSLFHVLRRLAPGKDGLYSWTDELTDEAARAKLFGAPISASFNMEGAKRDAILAITGGSYTNIRVVAMVLIVIMCATTFLTQKQIQQRSGPVEGQAATVQKILLYVMPAGLFVSGFLFPIGVLLYWFTNNLWTLGQQFFILRKMPPPGSDAAKAKSAEDRPDPRTLAPKPGAKPVRPKPGRPMTPTTATTPPALPPTADTAAPAAEGPPPVGDGSADGSPPGEAPGGAGGSTTAGQSPPNKGKRKRR